MHIYCTNHFQLRPWHFPVSLVTIQDISRVAEKWVGEPSESPVWLLPTAILHLPPSLMVIITYIIICHYIPACMVESYKSSMCYPRSQGWDTRDSKALGGSWSSRAQEEFQVIIQDQMTQCSTSRPCSPTLALNSILPSIRSISVSASLIYLTQLPAPPSSHSFSHFQWLLVKRRRGVLQGWTRGSGREWAATTVSQEVLLLVS